MQVEERESKSKKAAAAPITLRRVIDKRLHEQSGGTVAARLPVCLSHPSCWEATHVTQILAVTWREATAAVFSCSLSLSPSPASICMRRSSVQCNCTRGSGIIVTCMQHFNIAASSLFSPHQHYTFLSVHLALWIFNSLNSWNLHKHFITSE